MISLQICLHYRNQNFDPNPVCSYVHLHYSIFTGLIYKMKWHYEVFVHLFVVINGLVYVLQQLIDVTQASMCSGFS